MTALEQAIRDRDEYLEQHPELKQYQRDLDVAMSGITNPLERLQVLLAKMRSNLIKLRELSNDLHRQ